MIMIYAGLLLWIGIHLFPSIAPATKQRILARVGDTAYQGMFAVLILAGLLLIIFGWRGTVPTQVYAPAMGMRHLGMLIATLGILLFVASNFPSRIKRLIRHPQLTGVLLWSLAHLAMNGDSRSLTVFGALAAWSIISMFTINRRDGAWAKPTRVMGWGMELVMVVIGLVATMLILRFHQHLSGIALMG
jgi:uncharacterized membrane protein